MTKKLLIFSLILVSACSTSKRREERRTEAKRSTYIESSCNYNSAFRKGYNDAQTDKPMSTDLEQSCDPTLRTQVSTGYMDGYQAYVKAKPMEVNVGQTGPQQQTQVSGWTCLESYGKKECGFDCKQAYGSIKCAKESSHNCVENSGNIFCGLNCQVQNNQVSCKQGPY